MPPRFAPAARGLASPPPAALGKPGTAVSGASVPAQERTQVLHDWANRDLRDPDAETEAAVMARGTRPPAAPEPPGAGPDTHLFDTEDRLDFGEWDEAAYRGQRKGRVSWLAVLGLVCGVVGVLTALTVELVPVAVVAGLLGVLLGFGGLIAAHKPHVASRPLAVFAMVMSFGALTLAVLAATGDVAWLNHPNQAGWLRDWLNSHIPGLDRW